ncbi:hypothetical protein VP01_2367g1 [Puccinia sorghi]|uniref:Uncharacterized protein n=1 Tax=Puccinia sorghi TaxID=27349 RepID=A0A0L6V7U2_9BASI|nr:hypothetical protein VP01_2367g1 [Puccinia sorghi]
MHIQFIPHSLCIIQSFQLMLLYFINMLLLFYVIIISFNIFDKLYNINILCNNCLLSTFNYLGNIRYDDITSVVDKVSFPFLIFFLVFNMGPTQIDSATHPGVLHSPVISLFSDYSGVPYMSIVFPISFFSILSFPNSFIFFPIHSLIQPQPLNSTTSQLIPPSLSVLSSLSCLSSLLNIQLSSLTKPVHDNCWSPFPDIFSSACFLTLFSSVLAICLHNQISDSLNLTHMGHTYRPTNAKVGHVLNSLTYAQKGGMGLVKEAPVVMAEVAQPVWKEKLSQDCECSAFCNQTLRRPSLKKPTSSCKFKTEFPQLLNISQIKYNHTFQILTFIKGHSGFDQGSEGRCWWVFQGRSGIEGCWCRHVLACWGFLIWFSFLNGIFITTRQPRPVCNCTLDDRDGDTFFESSGEGVFWLLFNMMENEESGEERIQKPVDKSRKPGTNKV